MGDHVSEIMDEFYAYDEDLPLEAVEKPMEPGSSEGACFHITFDSARDERVSALLSFPKDATPPYPVVIILHGIFGHKTSPNQIKRSAALVGVGYATLRIDGQYSGERKSSVAGAMGSTHCYRNRDAMIQTAIDLRRGTDYLVARGDIDATRIGFAGFSMGGAIGATFCALDRRVRAVALGITGGDFDKLGVNAGARFRRAYRVVDPVRYVHRISPRPLLMLNAANDEVIPRGATEALYEAAREPKRIVWYDCGHADLPGEYLKELTGFFDTELA